MVKAVNLRDFIRDIPDFPVEGVMFRDVTPLLKNAHAFKAAIDGMVEMLSNLDFSCIVAPEARGFIFGSVISYVMNKGFVPIRKPGKLPYETASIKYDLEYGTAELQMHVDGLIKNERVVLIDDVLATGGTAYAIAQLVQKLEATMVGMGFLVELSYLNPRSKLKDFDVRSLIVY